MPAAQTQVTHSGGSAVSQPHIKLDITKSFVFGLLSQKL